MGRAVSESVPTEIGLRVKALRESAGIDQLNLSSAVKKSKAVIYQLERGIIVEPSAGLLVMVARVLGTTTEYLYFGEGEPPPREKILATFIRYADTGGTENASVEPAEAGR